MPQSGGHVLQSGSNTVQAQVVPQHSFLGHTLPPSNAPASSVSSRRTKVATAEDYAKGALEPQGATKNDGEKCLTCIGQGGGCKGNDIDKYLGRARCTTCKKHSRRCFWRDPALGILTLADGKAYPLYHDKPSITNSKNTKEGIAQRKAAKELQEGEEWEESLGGESSAQRQAAQQRQEDMEAAWLAGAVDEEDDE